MLLSVGPAACSPASVQLDADQFMICRSDGFRLQRWAAEPRSLRPGRRQIPSSASSSSAPSSTDKRSPNCDLTFLDGLRRTSPTPPPFLRPWFSTVTMHMSSVSQARSVLDSPEKQKPPQEVD
ncbi:hypothetical protein XENORESO_012858 [Xenotaenia resolanae]|uniref:Uncharacterized protein n=1 Tax=Xenotaenia resolanae TaxID=208358 RepID=A0ABV0WTJ1_9TELE